MISRLTSSCKVLYNFIDIYLPHMSLIIVNIAACIVGAIVFEWRTGLTSIALIPLIILAQAIQLSFIQGFSEFKGKLFNESSLIIN